ncbi:hypothetical protein [Leptospira ilyithenensis]|uniref:Uncharacterized protein n=1 Tax=Leptospira ilyithenensis TaxID=2484901 RepID=A0A4R9LRM0_9LEPT|nr:hypothetical protein [Leptospira ilyithenensis]TGN13710.1 hypothetical protein EHS11_03550 [Leptospira ilyithenensis]
MKFFIPFLILFGFYCTNFQPYHTEWKLSKDSDVFLAAVNAKASEKAISQDSIAMKRTTCVDAAKLLSTSARLTRYLVESEKTSLTESELQSLTKIVSSYNITPAIEECQSVPIESLFGSSEWESCQCLFSIAYPGGRKKFKTDLEHIR